MNRGQPTDSSLAEMSKVNFIRGPQELPADLTIMQLNERERNVVYSPEERLHHQDAYSNRPQRPDQDPR